MSRAALVGAIVMTIAVTGATPASAAPLRVATTPAAVIEGPRLAGDSLFYGEVGARRTVLRLASLNTQRKLASLPAPAPPSSEEEESPGDFTSFSSAIAASRERLAYSQAVASGNARYQVGTARLRLWGGGPAGPFDERADCSIDGLYGPVSAAIDVDGLREASTTCGGGIVIRDYSGPEPVVRSISPGNGLAAGAMAIAGRYIAFSTYPSTPSGFAPTSTEVRDWTTDTKAYEIPPQTSFDLRDDGTLVTSTGAADDLDCSDGKLAWHSVAEPSEHVLPVKPCTSDVRIAEGRIATVAAASDEHVLALVGLDGSRTDAARLGEPGISRGAIDYDGARVAYGLANCQGGADLFTDSASSPQPAATGHACPVEIGSTSTTLPARGRAVPLEIACELGCTGSAAIRMQVNGRLRVVASRRIRLAEAPQSPITCAPRFQIELPASARAEIRRRGRVTGHTIVTNRDLDGHPRTTKRRLTIRAESTRKAQSGCV